jgi:hypothetical protein
LGFVEIATELQAIESNVQLSSRLATVADTDPVDCSKKLLHCLNSSVRKSTELTLPLAPINQRYGSSSHLSKKSVQIIGRRGSREGEFFHPSSLAYSKQDQLICNVDQI